MCKIHIRVHKSRAYRGVFGTIGVQGIFFVFFGVYHYPLISYSMFEETHEGGKRVRALAIAIIFVLLAFGGGAVISGILSPEDGREDVYVDESTSLKETVVVPPGTFFESSDEIYGLNFENGKEVRVGVSADSEPYLALNVENDEPELLVRMPFVVRGEAVKDGSKIVYTSDDPDTKEKYNDRVDIVIYPKEPSEDDLSSGIEFSGGLVEFDTVLYAKPNTNIPCHFPSKQTDSIFITSRHL
jgi:hypothetical protein